jgi:hypothetical protein
LLPVVILIFIRIGIALSIRLISVPLPMCFGCSRWL